jgi:hypothetical protein
VVVAWEHYQMATKYFWLPNSLDALSFWGIPNFTYIKGFTFFIFLHFLFMLTCTTLIVLNNWCATFSRKGGRGVFHALFFVVFVISNLFAK